MDHSRSLDDEVNERISREFTDEQWARLSEPVRDRVRQTMYDLVDAVELAEKKAMQDGEGKGEGR